MHTVCEIPEMDRDDYIKSRCTHVCHNMKICNSRLAKLSYCLSEDQVYIYAYALHVFTLPTTMDEYCDLHMSRAYVNVLFQYGIEIINKFVESFGGTGADLQHHKVSHIPFNIAGHPCIRNIHTDIIIN